MNDWLNRLNGFIPHGYCYSWDPGLVWLHVVSNLAIAAAYFAIPVSLWVFVKRRRDLTFKPIFVMFGVFILACGLTHVMGVWTIWNATFWLDGGIKAVTAVVSLATAVSLWPLMPKALALPSPAALRRVNDELRAEIRARRRAEEELRQANERLRAQIEELEAFSSAISHDLRAPLRHMDGFSMLLLQQHADRLDERGKGFLARISASAKHLGRLVDDLLALSRTSRSTLVAGPVDTGVLVRTVVKDLAPDLERREVDLRIAPLPVVTGDAALLRQVFTNLLDNAIKYSRNRDRARIEIGEAAGGEREIILFVRDNGVGFDMQYADKLFGVFQRLHREAEFEGTGIGLANVRRIVERHGGRVWAQSQPGEGATFYLALPRGKVPEPKATDPTAPRGGDLGPDPTPGIAGNPAG